MNEEQFKQITEEAYDFLNGKGVNFICYMWDKEGEFGGGCQSIDIDMGDVMVIISNLVKHYSIDPDRLIIALNEAKAEMEKN